MKKNKQIISISEFNGRIIRCMVVTGNDSLTMKLSAMQTGTRWFLNPKIICIRWKNW